VQHEISDDGEWRPSGTATDGPLRRSPRKQSIPVRIHVRRSARNMVAERRQFKKDENSKRQALATVTDSSSVIEEVDATGIVTSDEHLKTELVPGWSFTLFLIGE
jgi:phosphopantothenate synthetase